MIKLSLLSADGISATKYGSAKLKSIGMSEPLSKIIDERFGMPAGIGGEIPAEEPLATILSRRTHRRFSDEPVPDQLLDVLFACAQSASSKSDLQQYTIINLRDPAKRAAIAKLIQNMRWLADAPVFVVFCGDMRRAQRVSAMRGHANVNNTLDSFMNCAVDAALAMQTFILAAESQGLGCCPISAVRVCIDEVSAILELPDGVFPMSGLCVGYPAGPAHQSMRLPPETVVHIDRYDDSELEAEIAAYDSRRERHHATRPEHQLYPDRFGVANPYGWSENVARRLTIRERERFKPYLEAHGFDLD